MRRNFLRSLLICLVPTLAAAAFVGYGFYRESNENVGFRRGIDLAGGTILICEVDREKAGRDLDSTEIKTLAEKLKKRIDENDLKNVVVRPVGTNRVEIILPFAAKTGSSGEKGKANDAEFVEEVRQKVRQAGVLKFTILANLDDDRDGIEAARRIIDDPSDEDKKKLTAAAEKGAPPPGPEQEFTVKAAGTEELPVNYVWLEIGKDEREDLGLSEKYEKEAPDARSRSAHMYPLLEKFRNKTYVSESTPNGQRDTSYVIYSRPFVKKDPTEDEKGKKVEYFILTRRSDRDTLSVKDDVRVRAYPTSDRNGFPAVGFEFTTPNGANRFRQLTERNRRQGFHRQMAIVLDEKIVSAPQLNDPLPGAGIIEGGGRGFRIEDVNQLISILRSGNLNAELKPDPVSENTIGATLGAETKRNGLIAVAGSFAAVMIFMVIYYRFAGLVACVALFINLLMTVGFMVAMHAAFTLPGLAGMVLMLGMAVDANVLIYERLREERERGATLTTAIRNGYDRALPTIIDTHFTSIFTSIVLYMFGNDALKGFSVALTVGLIISLFTSLYITRLMFDFWTHKRWLTELRMMKLFARPKFDFMKIRYPMFALTAFLTVAGLVLFLWRGEKVLNVDFTQGTAYGGRLKDGQAKTLPQMLALLSKESQDSRLKVEKVEPAILADAAEAGKTAEQIYNIYYVGESKPATVALSNKPEGATPAEQLENLKARASRLPDVSVEQVFVGDDASRLGGGQSQSFTVRTTEKEKELVQVMLDRLLREGDDPLLEKVKAQPFEVTGPSTSITFDKPVTPAYLKDFILRELKIRERLPQAVDPTSVVEVKGVFSADAGTAAEEGRTLKFRTVTVDVSKNSEFPRLNDPKETKEGKEKERDALQRALVAAKNTFESRPVPERLETFDPALAKDTRTKALMAILLSWVAILAYLWFRFGSWQFGLAAVLCLIHDLCFTLGCIAVCHYLHDTTIGSLLRLQDFKIDLAAVAALLTLVGYSVNDTIVVFDRIREVRGKNPMLTPQMINDSVNGTLSRTVLAALTVFLVVVVLYWFGGEGVHLFAFVMVMGVIVGTYSSIYIASPLLLIFGEGKSRFKTRTPGGDGPTQPTADQPGESAPVSAIAS
jgi:SecD/SecF fusion protein